MSSAATADPVEILTAAATVQQVGDAYLAQVHARLASAATVAGIVRRFQREWGATPVADLTARLIQSWQYARLKERTRVGGRPVTMSTVNHEISVLSTMLDWAVRNDILPGNPTDRVKRFRVRNRRLGALTREQSAALLGACIGRRQHLRGIVLMAINTGMRRGELLALRWSDLDLGTPPSLHVRESKNGEDRHIPLMPSVAEYLRRERRGAQGAALVFRHGDGTPFRSVATSWAGACRVAGVPRTHLHDLRHTFASRLLLSGADVATLQEVMGHRTPAMALRYSHSFNDAKKAAIERMDMASGVAP